MDYSQSIDTRRADLELLNRVARHWAGLGEVSRYTEVIEDITEQEHELEYLETLSKLSLKNAL